MIWAELPPTEARALVPTNRPTISPSTALYSCWIIVPAAIGRKKTSSFFHTLPSVRKLYVHLVAWVKVHGNVYKVFVQKRNAAFNTPCHEALVCTQAVVEVQLAHLAHKFFVEFFCVGCLVEIEVAAKELVASFSRKNHLYSHGFYYPCKKVHGCACADSCNVISFYVVDYVRQRIQCFLYCKVNFVVNSSNVVCCLLCGNKVRGTFKSYRK